MMAASRAVDRCAVWGFSPRGGAALVFQLLPPGLGQVYVSASIGYFEVRSCQHEDVFKFCMQKCFFLFFFWSFLKVGMVLFCIRPACAD